MKNLVAYCGLNCDSCPIYLATREPDKSCQKDLRKSITKLCYENYGMVLKVEDVTDCDGCRNTSGRFFTGCMNCEIRICANKKKLTSCALCPDYACEPLEKIFNQDPEAKLLLRRMRSAHMV